MSGKLLNKAIMVLVVLSAHCFNAMAEGGVAGSYSPYSIYGVGDIAMPGSAYNRTMAGVGIADRTHRFINPLNPASVSARDSLAFMVDFSLFGSNKYFYQGNMKSVYNIFSVGDFIMSFPIYGSLAASVGIMPYSSTGYSYSYRETDPLIITSRGATTHTHNGIGSIYQLFAGLGVAPFRNFSLGAQAIYYFGTTEHTDLTGFGKEAIPDISSTTTKVLKGITGKFGAQYEINVGKSGKIGLGATYKLSTPMRGDIEMLNVSTRLDTVRTNPGNVRFADELGLGISFRHSDRLMFEFDYSTSNWTDCGLDDNDFFAVKDVETPMVSARSQAFRFGMEYVPNRSDIRYYYKKIAYRTGLYYTTDYYTAGGHPITSKGITLGFTFPVFRFYNGVTFGLDFGQRGTVKYNLVKENYFNISVSVNLFDIWFQKYRYE